MSPRLLPLLAALASCRGSNPGINKPLSEWLCDYCSMSQSDTLNIPYPVWVVYSCFGVTTVRELKQCPLPPVESIHFLQPIKN